MKTTRLSWLFALMLLIALPVSAQPSWVGPLMPAQPTTSDQISLEFTVSPAYNLCDLMMPGEVSVSREGGDISIAYTLRERTEDDPPLPAGTICLGTYGPPFPVTADLGYLPAGDYDVAISLAVGIHNHFEPSASSFTVLGVPVVESIQIPTNATWALSLMLLALGGVAMWRLRAH